MEAQTSEHGYIIEVSSRGSVGSKSCDVSSCRFADAKTTSKDAQELSNSMRKLWIAVVLCLVFMSVEVAGGIKANSLAILTDATHLLSDVASFAISLFALWAAGWEATPRQSYGFFRIEILGALVSIQLIWLLTGILVYEAITRLVNETGEVQGFLMLLVSAFGFLVNIIMAILLGHGHGHGHGHDHDHGHNHEHHVDSGPLSEPLLDKSRDINVQGAYLHVLGDSIQSVGVAIINLLCEFLLKIASNVC